MQQGRGDILNFTLPFHINRQHIFSLVKKTLLFFFLIIACTATAQTQQQAAIERIKTSGNYRYGEARAATAEEAEKRALEKFLAGIRQSVVSENTLTESQQGSDYNLSHSSSVKSVSAMTLPDCETITYSDGNQWVAFKYITLDNIEKSISRRRNLIREFIETGIDQERQLNISGALKYYSWAKTMLSAYNDDVTVDIDGRRQNAASWLQLHIPAVLDNISFTLDDSKIEYDTTDYDCYTVNLDVAYNGRPASFIDASYFNGERTVGPVHAKSGHISLRFHDLSLLSAIDMKVIYDYPEEAELYDPDLRAAYAVGRRSAYDSRASFSIPVHADRDKIQSLGQTTKPADAQPTDITGSAASDSAMPLEADDIDTISRPDATGASQGLISAMQQVEIAIRSRDYTCVRGLFSAEGYSLFSAMMNSGKVSVSRKPERYTVESTALFTVGKGIPVSIKNGRHISNETIVFRFNSEGLIKSVAYALSQRAEDDIFREADWNIESRYSLLTFMEDYQTAFALRRLDLFRQIYSDDAIIITGQFIKPAKSRMVEGNFHDRGAEILYRSYDKDSYLQKLERDFLNKSFIQISFEDTWISKVDDGGLLDNEVIWIELKQQYTSSNYSDKGFLALQINLRPSGSQINVRTWTPTFMPLAKLKRSYPIGIAQ